jgi:hypothetical protein
MFHLGTKLDCTDIEMSALHRLAGLLSVRAHRLAGRNENARRRQETMGFLCEFLLVHGTAHVGALVRNSSLFLLKRIVESFRHAYVVLQYMIQQSYSIERKEEE